MTERSVEANSGRDNLSGWWVLLALFLSVAARASDIQAPAQVPIAAKFEVSWEGPNVQGDFIQILPAGSPVGTWPTSYLYASAGSPQYINAPREPGKYEIRYAQGGKEILASKPLTVYEPEIVLTVKEPVTFGTDFEVLWQAPNSYKDSIVLAGRGSLSGTAIDLAWPAEGNPVILEAPRDLANFPDGLVLRYMSNNFTVYEQPVTFGESVASPMVDATEGTGTLIARNITLPENAPFSVDLYGTAIGSTTVTVESGGEVVHSGLVPGRYVTGSARTHEYDLTDVQCEGLTAVNPPAIDLEAGKLTVDLEAGQTVTCNLIHSARGRVRVIPTLEPKINGAFTYSGRLSGSVEEGRYLDAEYVSVGSYSVVQSSAPEVSELLAIDCDDGGSINPSTGDIEKQAVEVRVDPGEFVTCRFVNGPASQLGAVTLESVASSAIPDLTYQLYGTLDGTLATGGSISRSYLAAGTYRVTVQGGSAEYPLSDIQCDDGSSATPSGGDPANSRVYFNVDPGETVRCRLLSAPVAQPGKLIMKSVTVPEATVGQFTLGFEAKYADGSAENGSFVVATNEEISLTLTPGVEYKVGQNPPNAGFAFTGVECDDAASESPSQINGSSALVVSEPGETIRCSFINTLRGSARVQWNWDSANPASLTFEGTPAGEVSSGQWLESKELSPGSYGSKLVDIPEAAVLQSVQCNDASSISPSEGNIPMRSALINVDPGESIDCIFFLTTGTFPLNIKTLTGEIYTVQARAEDTVLSVKQQVEAQTGTLAEQQRLIYDGEQLPDESTLSELNIAAETNLYLVLRLRGDAPATYPIYVKTLTGEIYTVQVSAEETVLSVKQQVEAQTGTLAEQQRLIYDGEQLPDESTLSELNIAAETTLYLVLRLRGDTPATYPIYVKTLTGEIYTVQVSAEDTVLSVKQQVEAQTGPLAKQQRLIYAGEQMPDQSTLSELNIAAESTVHLILRLRAAQEISISVQLLDGDIISLGVYQNEAVSSVKQKLAATIGVEKINQPLFFENKKLDDQLSLDGYGIGEGDVLEIKIKKGTRTK